MSLHFVLHKTFKASNCSYFFIFIEAVLEKLEITNQPEVGGRHNPSNLSFLIYLHLHFYFEGNIILLTASLIYSLVVGPSFLCSYF